MNEITCSQCGAANPGQSKYCNRCGASLGNENTHICPSCGTANPLTLLYCDHCGTRLIDDASTGSQQEESGDEDDITRSEPFSLPSRPPGQTGNLDVSSALPDWLKTGEFSTGPDESGEEHTEESDHPEWLRAAHKEDEWEDEEAPTLEELSEDHKPQDDLPTWLLDETTADQIFSGDKSTDELYMASLSSDDDDAPRETGSVLKDDLPEWLRGLSSPEEDPAPLEDETSSTQRMDTDPPDDAAESVPPGEPDTVSELQGWLSDMEEADSDPAEAVFGEPDETAPEPDESEEEMAGAGLQTRFEEEDDFLNWLSDIQEDTSAGDDLPTVRGSDPLQHTGLPAWLDDSDLDVAPVSEDADQSQDMADADQAPAWLLDLPEESFENDGVENASTVGVEAPDWLEVDQKPAAEDLEPQSAQPSPGKDDPMTPSGESADDIELARRDQPHDNVAFEAPGQDVSIHGDLDEEGIPQQDIPEDEFLQWLDSLDTTSPSIDVAAQQTNAVENLAGEADSEWRDAGEEDDELEGEVEAGLPDWLGEFSEAEDDVADQTIADVEALPEWLRDLAPPGAEVTLPYVTGTTEDDAETVPGDDEVGSVEGDTPIEQEPVSGSHDSPDIAAFPDWLDGVTDELDDTTEADRPRTADATKALDEDEMQSGDEEFLLDSGELQLDVQSIDLGDQDVPQEDLPDWFSDVLMSMEPQDAPESPQSLTALTNVPEQLAGDELPQWLDSPFSDETAAEPTPIDEIPEWLRAPLRERLARAAEDRGLDEPALESGDEWRELLASAPTGSEEPRSAPASDVNAWLASLREETTSGISDAGRSVDDKEAADSPVAGLQGTIGIAPVVAQTAKRAPVASIAEQDQAQQAALLQQLARSQQEDSGTNIATHPRESGFSMPGRILLSILLLAAVVMGLLTSNSPVNPSGEPSLDSDATIGAEMLGITTEQPVLLVIDYTPALAGALQTSAADVVRAVGLEGNHLLVTSQSAAGLGLADPILETAGATQVDALGFIPGGAAGVRRLGRCLGATGGCDDLFGQPVDPAVTAHLADVAHVIVVTGDRDNLMAWIEQFSNVNFISMVAIVTPAIQPVAAPYLATGQLDNLGIAMGASIQDSSIMGARAAPALLYAHWLVLISVAGGAIYYLAIGALRMRRK